MRTGLPSVTNSDGHEFRRRNAKKTIPRTTNTTTIVPIPPKPPIPQPIPQPSLPPIMFVLLRKVWAGFDERASQPNGATHGSAGSSPTCLQSRNLARARAFDPSPINQLTVTTRKEPP